MKVLIGCEFSGIVRDAFLEQGHDATSCDLIDTESSGPHIIGNILDVAVTFDWDLMIFHWPCTRLCNSGVRWLYGGKGTVPDHERWSLMKDDAHKFRLLLDMSPDRMVCGENPIPHRYAAEIMGPYTQIIQPWQFGHGETKATCLWLRNLPELKPTNIVAGRSPRVHHASPGPERWKERSRTMAGIAQAMAKQWGALEPVLA